MGGGSREWEDSGSAEVVWRLGFAAAAERRFEVRRMLMLKLTRLICAGVFALEVIGESVSGEL